MFIVYGDYQIDFTLTGSHSGAAFLSADNGAAMNDGHSSLVSSMSWIGGTQTTASYLEIVCKVQSPLDKAPAVGGVGLVNVTGLPEGTLVQFNGAQTQRLRQGPNGKLQAWFLPQTHVDSAGTVDFQIFNDVNSVASIPAGQPFGIGEIVIGRAIYLPTLIASQPGASLVDSTAFQTNDGGSENKTLRYPSRTVTATLGRFRTSDVNSSFYSSVQTGGNPEGTISLRRLQEILVVANCVAICDIPGPGRGGGIQNGRFVYDQEFMQENWQLARLNDAGTIQMDQPPYWSWSTSFKQST
jgi:hypothetical protein